VTEAAPGARYAALAVSSRRRLLEVLQSAEEPLDVGQLAAAVGLRGTTARVHLEVLERAGLVRRAVQLIHGWPARRPKLTPPVSPRPMALSRSRSASVSSPRSVSMNSAGSSG